MNRRLRTRHRRIFGALALLLPVGLSAALYLRVPIPAHDSPATDIARPDPVGPSLDVTARFADSRIRCSVWPGGAGQVPIVELRTLEDLALPDLLLYWGPTQAPTHELAGDEFLLGGFSGTRPRHYELPRSDSPDLSGRLVLYSLAQGAVIVSASLEGLGG